MSEDASPTEPGTVTGLSSGRRNFLKAAGATGAALSMAGCTLGGGGGGGGFADTDEIKLGLITAPQSTIGKAMVRTAEMAVDHINENDGIAGKDVSLHVGDSQVDPNQAVTAYRNLVDDEGIHALTGIWISEVGMTLLPNIADDELVTMATAMGTPEATAEVSNDYDRYKYYFRSQMHTGQMVEWSIDYINEFLIDELGIETIGLLVEDALWTEPYGSGLREFLEGNDDLDLVYQERPATDVSEFGPILQDVADEGPDLLYTIFSHLAGTTFFNPWERNQYNFMIDGFIATAPSFNYWRQTNGEVNFAASKYQAGFSQEFPAMTQEYIERQPEDDVVFPQYQTYDGIQILASAMESAQTLDSDELVAELEDISHEGVGGVIEFRGQDESHTHNQRLGLDYFYPREVQWSEIDAENPISGGGFPYVTWPAYEDYALVDDVGALEAEGLPLTERGEYSLPPWVSL